MSKGVKITVDILVRILLLAALVVVSAYLSDPAHNLLVNELGYQNPAGFFMPSWADSILAWNLTFVLLSLITFVSLGKKLDYGILFLVLLLTLWIFTGTDNVTPPVYLVLIGVGVVGSAIGYGLKFLRLRFLPNFLSKT